MDIGKSFTYMFDDPQWLTKLGVGALMAMVPIANFATMGYGVDIIRKVSHNDPNPLPTWDDFSQKLINGLTLFAVILIYNLPVLLLSCASMFLVMLPAMASGSSSRDAEQVLASVMGAGMLLTFCLIFLYVLAFSFFFPAVQLHFARVGTFGACFQVGAILNIITTYMSDYIVAWLISIGVIFIASFVLGTAGTILGLIPCLGQVGFLFLSGLSGAWIMAVSSHAYGQVGVSNS